MNLYPIYLHLEGRRCIVVGAGKVAERKVIGLRAAGAAVCLVSPEATPSLQALAEDGLVEWLREPYRSTHLDGAFLVMACTDKRQVNATVARDAKKRSMLLLVADDPKAGSFMSPIQVTRGDLVLTVSTGGQSPTLAAVLRERLEEQFGPEWDLLIELMGQAREVVKTNPDEAGRKAAVRRVLDDVEIQEMLSAGKRLEAETRIRECLSLSSE